MPAPTVEQLANLLGAPLAPELQQVIAQLEAVSPFNAQQVLTQLQAGVIDQDQALAVAQQSLSQLTGQQLPGPTAAPTAVGPTGESAPFIDNQQAGQFNVPFGADFLDPQLQFLLGVLGLQQGGEQFGQQLQFAQAQALAGLRSQPGSAAELALLQSQLGMPTGLPSQFPIEQLLGASTQGAGGTATGQIGGSQISAPNTLSGQQLSQLAGNPNAQGVLSSFSRFLGNPDILARSAAAALPAGFQGVGSGL